MTPIAKIRRGFGQATGGERTFAIAVPVVVIALLALVIVQHVTSSGSSKDSSGSANGAHCTNPEAAVPGVTSSQIKVAISLVDITGLASNAAEGIPSTGRQKADYSAVIKAINASGGVDCRTLVARFFDANPADQNQLQQNCLNIVQAGVFASVDAGSYASFPVVDCFPQHKIPYIGGYTLPTAQMTKFYPYLFEFNSSDSLYKTTISALNARGFFNPANGYKKLGIYYQDCTPQTYAEVRSALTQAGVPASSIVSYDVGCPTAFTSSTTIEQAILKFKQAGVTNVTPVDLPGDFPTFTKLAAAQNFTPKYGLADDQIISTSYGTSPPDYANINGALAVSQSRVGEERTPGVTPSAGTLACDKILAEIGQPSVYKGPVESGNICDEMWELKAAIDHSSTLSQSSLADGLHTAKSVIFSYPQGPNDFSAGNVTWAGQFYRVNEFSTSCNCWRLVDQTFHPSVP